MKNKFFRTLVASLVVSSCIVTTVGAAPDADTIKEQRDSVQSQVNSLQSQLTEVLTEINDLERQLIATGEQITQATEDLAEAEEKEKEQYEAMKLRIKYMYEEGNNTVLEKIFTSGSIGEMLSQAEYIQNVHKYDRDQLNEYVETKEKIADLKEQLEEEQKELEATQEEFTAKKESLNATLEEKKEEVADLDAQFQAAVEAAAKEAEEKARKEREAAEAAAAEKNNSNKNNSNKNNSNNNTNNNNSNNNSNNNISKPSTPSNNGGSSSTSGGGTGDTSVAQVIVNAAYSQLGTPYVWGGTSPGVGLDCSGLTQYCHRVAGISIPRVSGDQGAGGKAVSSPLPGDIVCYSGHVGIYIGNGQMIHAPEPGDVVKIQSVYGNPWYRRYW